MRRPAALTAVAVVALVGVGWVAARRLTPRTAPSSCEAPLPVASAPQESVKAADRLAGRTLRLPTGEPAAMSCDAVRRVVAQARAHLATAPDAVDPRALADGTVDWLDPHGLWSASPDAPLGALLRRRERDLLHELEVAAGHGGCRVAQEAGELMAGWVVTLATAFDDGETHAPTSSPAEAWKLAAAPAFEDRVVARPAREFARELGHTVGVVGRSFGPALGPYCRAARARFLPQLTARQWSEVVLAAALRAYLPQIDPHGGWAPLDEETSLYEVDLEAAPPPRLWDRMVRTPLGVRVDAGMVRPVEAADVVLGVADVPTAGLSVEQVEQLAMFDDIEPTPPRTVTVLREGESAVRELVVEAPADDERGHEASGAFPVERVAYGAGDVAVIEIGDVPDDLGELLAVTIAQIRVAQAPVGIVLDLRGNGGGSTDGANAAVGLFLPGARLFPMKRRDGLVETERAPEPPETDRWAGPVASLVDAETASAAEMIAGALASYRRGPLAGYRTYGKGCAQEYLDDDAHQGVLRLTTLVYALPDGVPVQRVGLLPTLDFGRQSPREREAKLLHAPPTWRGPDMRDRERILEVPWPGHHGRVGPCHDEAVCRALRALGAPRPAVARGRR